MQNIGLLSLVVPFYRQEKTVVNNIKHLEVVLSEFPFPFEIVGVVDGFEDKTYKNAKKLECENIRVLGYEKNQGKGHAVRYGMLKAKGDVIGFIDGGMDINATGISLMLDSMIWNDADIVVGSKLHPESKVDYPLIRKIMSWGYRTLTHLLFGFNVRDTQVGLKLFKRNAAKDIFSRIVVKSFAFDVEVLAVAYKLGYKKIFESPIRLNFGSSSSIASITSTKFWKVIFLMLWDTAAIFYRLKILHYYDRTL